MIDDLDKTLELLLKRTLPPALVSQVTITFAAPDDQFPPQSVTLPAIDLFLYDLRENRDLRSNEWVVEWGDNGTQLKQRAPMRMDCSYLITAWASQSSTTPSLDEHRLLGEVVKVLLRYRSIPLNILQGSLAVQDLPLPTTTLQPGRLQSSAEFWQALGGKLKAVLNYVVTISVVAEGPIEGGPPVTDKLLKLKNIAEE